MSSRPSGMLSCHLATDLILHGEWEHNHRGRCLLPWLGTVMLWLVDNRHLLLELWTLQWNVLLTCLGAFVHTTELDSQIKCGIRKIGLCPTFLLLLLKEEAPHLLHFGRLENDIFQTFVVTSPTPQTNVMLTSLHMLRAGLLGRKRIGKAKMFQCADGGVRICYREYIGDVTTTNRTFDNIMQWRLNPGLATEFPWLSGIAGQFQEYKWNNLAFSYISRSATAVNSTDLALGSLMMATDYNTYNPLFPGKLACLQMAGCVSSGPQSNFVHVVNVKPSTTVVDRFYVRGTTVPEGDLRLYDLGTTQLCCQGFQAATTVGEIWVNYDVTFYKPKLDTQTEVGLEGPGLASMFIGNDVLCNTITTFEDRKQLGTTATAKLVRNGVFANNSTDSIVYQLPPCGEDLPATASAAPDFVTWIPNSTGGIFAFKELAVGKFFCVESLIIPAGSTPVNPVNGTLYRSDIVFSFGGHGAGIVTWAGLSPEANTLGSFVEINDSGDYPTYGQAAATIPTATCLITTASAPAPYHRGAMNIKVVASGYLNDANPGTALMSVASLASSPAGISNWRGLTMNAGDVASWKISFREIPGPGVKQGAFSDAAGLSTAMQKSSMVA